MAVFKLRPFQQEIADKIDSKFRPKFKSHKRRVTGTVIATGGGKSYVCVDQILKTIGEYNSEEGHKPQDTVSDVPIVGFAPTDAIINQTKCNIFQYIIVEDYIKKFYKGDIVEALKAIGKRLSSVSKGLDFEKLIMDTYKDHNYVKLSHEEIIRQIFLEKEYEISTVIDKIIAKELPKLNIMCNANIPNIDIDRIFGEDTRLVFFDEAHRTGAETWGPIIDKILTSKKLQKANFLFMTATPVRDADGFDPVEYYAALAGSYTLEELRKKDYLSSDIPLWDALEQDLVTKPEVICFDCLLDETDEYEEMRNTVIELYEKYKIEEDKFNARLSKNHSAKPSQKYSDLAHQLFKSQRAFVDICKATGKFDYIKQNWQTLQTKMDPKTIDAFTKLFNNESLGIPDEHHIIISFIKLLDKDAQFLLWKEAQVQAIVQNEIKNRPYLMEKKHICFPPRTSKANGDAKDIFARQRDSLKKRFGFPDNRILCVHSNGEVISKKQSDDNLNRFMHEKVPYVMMAMDKFNEGLHVDDVIALEMERPISGDGTEGKSPKIVFLQEIGRVIRGKAPGEVVKETPVIFDFACNFMRFQEMLKTKDGTDLFKLTPAQQIFLKKYKEFQALGDVTMQKDDEFVARKKAQIIPQTLELMRILSIFKVKLSDVPENCKLQDLLDQVDPKTASTILDTFYSNTGKRFDGEYNIGLYITSVRRAFWHAAKQYKPSETYYSEKTDEIFSQYSIKELHDMGLFSDMESAIEGGVNKFNELLRSTYTETKCVPLNRYGYIAECAIKDATGLNIFTGTRLDRDNSDIDGFNSMHYNTQANSIFDTRMFYYDDERSAWINLLTNAEYDLLGYNRDGEKIASIPEFGYNKLTGFYENGINIETHTYYDRSGRKKRSARTYI